MEGRYSVDYVVYPSLSDPREVRFAGLSFNLDNVENFTEEQVFAAILDAVVNDAKGAAAVRLSKLNGYYPGHTEDRENGTRYVEKRDRADTIFSTVELIEVDGRKYVTFEVFSDSAEEREKKHEARPANRK